MRLREGRAIDTACAIVAAGAWSHRLAATLGQRIPLETERGYNTTLPPGAFALQRQLTFADHGFVMTPIGGGVRVGGAVELGGVDAPPDYRRAPKRCSSRRSASCHRCAPMAARSGWAAGPRCPIRCR